MAVEPSQSTAQDDDRCALLLVCKHVHVGEPIRVINGQMKTVIADAGRAALLKAIGDAVVDFTKAS